MPSRKKRHPWEKFYPEGLKWDTQFKGAPLFKVLDDSAEKYPDNLCLDFLGRKYTYLEIKQSVDKMAAGMQELGIGKGSKVGLLMPNCPHYVISYYAVLKTGATIVNCNPLYTINELVKQVQDSGMTTMITLNLNILFEKGSKLLQTTPIDKLIIGDFAASLPFPKNKLFAFLHSDEIASVLYSHVNINMEKLIENAGNLKEVTINPDYDVAVLQYTGGTTGVAKAAMLTHSNLYINTIQTGMWFQGLEQGKEKILGVLPFFHVFAMTVILNLGISEGCAIILQPRLNLLQILKDIRKKKITLMPGVPTLFTAINNHKGISRDDLKSLKFCFSGGAPLPVEVKDKFEELSQCKLIEGYGLTETSPVVCANPLFGVSKAGSIGIPFPGTIIEIRDINGRHGLVQKEKVGEICITGPQVMKGYLSDDEDKNQTLKAGRLRTGDLGYMDKEGYIFVVDRLKEMIITSGFNVYPREIEEALYQHQKIAEAAVIGIQDEYRGQAVKAFIVLRAGEELSEMEVKTFLKSKLTKYKVPSEIEFRKDMPKTLIGKIDKKALVTPS